jgi:hypothetical protein
MMTTDSKSTAQFAVSRDNAKLFAGGILQIRMQRYKASKAYILYYIEIIEYMLAANRFSLHLCKIIQDPVICATLNKMGINRNVSRHIVFVPKDMGGMALRHIHTLQGISCIQYLIGHITNNDGVAKLMRICIEATQLEVGTFKPFFFIPLSLVSRLWINEIWSFIELFSGTITILNTWLTHPQRLHGQAIMSLAVLFSQNKGELIQINIYRIYLGAISIPDICNFDGTRITQQSYDGTFVMKNLNIFWPNQHRPSKGGWLVWRRFLRSIADRNRYVFQPLGKWKELAVLNHDHEWYIITPHRALIQKRGNQWFLHERQGRGSKFYASCPHVLLSTPTLWYIAQVKVHRTSIECIDDIAIIQSPIQHILFS